MLLESLLLHSLPKFISASLAARAHRLVWRESFTIGSLMSCKSLVELIVLNIGLQAKILSQRTFTIFVVMALVTTFATTPLTSALYPPWYQKKIEAWKRGEIDWATGKPTGVVSAETASTRDSISYQKMEASKIRKMLVYLRLDNMPTLLAFVSLLGGTPQETTRTHPSKLEDIPPPTSKEKQRRPIEAHGVRLLELTERESSVMRVSEVEEFSLHDPLANAFRTVGNLHNVAVSVEVAVLPESSFADALATKGSILSSGLMLIPWSETGSMSETAIISSETTRSKLAAPSYSSFVIRALNQASCTTAVFINRNFGGSTALTRPALSRSKSAVNMQSLREGISQPTDPVADRSHHIFCPFFGGADDRVALRLVLQMAENPEVTATVVFLETNDKYFVTALAPKDDHITRSPTASSSRILEIHRVKSATANVNEAEVLPSEQDAIFFNSLKNSLPAELSSRVVFEPVNASMEPLKMTLERAALEVRQHPRNAGDLIIVGRNIARLAAFETESRREVDDASRSLGVLGAEAARSGLQASVVVVQASERRDLRLEVS